MRRIFFVKNQKVVLIIAGVLSILMIASYWFIPNPFEFNRTLRSNLFLGVLMPIFIHRDISHLVNNILILLILAFMLRNEISGINFMIIFIVSGVAGNLLTIIINPEINAIGSSGSIYGLIGTSVFTYISMDFRNKKISWQVIFLLVFLFFNMINSMDNDAINSISHVSGFLLGILMAMYLKMSNCLLNDNII